MIGWWSFWGGVKVFCWIGGVVKLGNLEGRKGEGFGGLRCWKWISLEIGLWREMVKGVLKWFSEMIECGGEL